MRHHMMERVEGLSAEAIWKDGIGFFVSKAAKEEEFDCVAENCRELYAANKELLWFWRRSTELTNQTGPNA